MNYFGDYTQCPYDKSHRIIRGRLQTHLVKCAKNYPEGNKLVCIFDASHIVDPQNYENHLKECENSRSIKCYQQSLEPKMKLGTISLESACSMKSTESTMNGENWFENNPTYDPLVASEEKNVVRAGMVKPKAEKKKYKQRERERVAKLVDHNKINNNITSVKQPELETLLRVPKKVIKALSDSNSLNTIANRICYNKIISKLEKVSMEENMENFETKINISELKNNNSLKISKENEVEKTIPPQKLNEEKTTCLNPRIAATLYRQTKQIRTRRRFTIAYENLKSEAKDNQEVIKTSENFYSIYGYDEDESDDNVTAIQNK
ncbi:uncharacterized protein LOC143345109 [Colletes latitarsis]|uniref:uncharacterized protein LOC143345109 n=1 Tax=Colletes latitarsis TaxID=2605962 RepID=UPI0040366148